MSPGLRRMSSYSTSFLFKHIYLQSLTQEHYGSPRGLQEHLNYHGVIEEKTKMQEKKDAERWYVLHILPFKNDLVSSLKY